MEDLHGAYLTLLDALSSDMEQLAKLAQEQCAAVRRDDLNALNDVMKREQVIGLSLRGREQKRVTMAAQLGLEGTRLSSLIKLVPRELLPRAQETVERLRRSYDLYRNAAQAARTTLEINLHEIEKIVAAHGIDPMQGTDFLHDAAPAPPKNMKTDFRA